jgi:hypothetical protein
MLPNYIYTHYGSEVWAVDDFGIGTGDEFWKRSRSPTKFIEQNPEIHYVVERLGDQTSSSLLNNYFDVIYSVSTLEHVPGSMQLTVWKHMDALLKPGGELIHAIDIDFPSNFGMKGMLKAAALNGLYWFLPLSIREKFFSGYSNSLSTLCFEPSSNFSSKGRESLDFEYGVKYRHPC